ncbi:aspartate kinase, partial [Patescibacteria group bacterium]|nr:aspartate kinase [Patescibacteria group bacterium]
KELSLSALDRLQSFGERVSSNILAALLEKNGVRSRSVDAYSIIYADNNFGEGNVDIERTNEAIQTTIQGLLDDGITPVITGFIGQAENRQYITLGRGGSDYTAAIVAAALSASELQIWTDVDGIFNADPRLIQDAQALDRLSFEEASELAFFGAKVLHPKTINPAVAANIPVKILNTFNVDAPGTLIVNDENESIKSVTYKKDITIINVCSTGMLAAHGFLARIFEVFARNNISVDVVSTSEVSVSLTVENGVADNVIEELSEFARVNVQKNMAIVCLVGNGIRSTAGVLGNLFSGLNEFNISMVSQGASQRNITFLVDENDAQNVVQNIFRRFFN